MIYLDNNATMPMLPAAATAVRKVLKELKGNPQYGKQVLAEAQAAVNNLFGADGSVVLTSGGTENAAIAFSTALWRKGSNGVTCSLADHISVLNQHSALSNKLQSAMEILPLTKDGQPDPVTFQKLVSGNTAMLTLTLVNSETGVVATEVQHMAQAAKASGSLVFLDACQAVGRLNLKGIPDEVDMISISSHKFGGPAGAGALWVRKGVDVYPAWGGGFHQAGVRAGACSDLSIAGMTAALRHAEKNLSKDFGVMSTLRKHIDQKMLQIEGLTINFGDRDRVCNTSSYLIKGVNSKVLSLLLRRRGIIISDGTSGLADTSAVSPLMMFLHSAEDCYSNIRISLGRQNTREELDTAVQEIARAVKTLRKLFPQSFPGAPR